MEVSAGQPSAGELIDILAAHFLRSRSCSIQLERILLAQPSNADTVTGGELAERAFHVLDVSLVDLANTQPMLVEQVVKDPLLLLKHFQRACTVSQHYMQAKHERSEHMQVKPNTKVRVFGIPGAHEPCLYKETLHSRKLVSPRVGEIRSCMSNRLITICGTITKLGSPHLVEYKQQFECNRCHMRFDVDIDIHAGGHVQLPEVCPNNSARNRGRKRRKKQRRASNNDSQQSQQSHSQSQSQSQMIEEEASGGCQGVHFSRCEEVRFHKDCQEIRVQELTYRGSNRNSSSRGSAGTGGGGGGGGGGRQNPKSITVRLEDELVDQFRPGDDVLVTGVLIQHWRRVGRVEMQCDVELVVDAVHVAHLNKMGKASFDFDLTKKKEAPLSLMKPSAVSASPSNALEPFGNPSDADKDFDGWVRQHWEKYASKPLAGRNLIVGSLSPQVHGMFMAKLAVMLVLCGGVPLQSNTNLLQSDKTTRAGGAQPQQSLKSHSVRGECHLLLAGDPGTGKSQLMRCAAKLSKRSVVTNGRGSTNAGLTATAVISRGGGGGAGGSAALKGSGGGGKLGKGGRGSEWTLEAGALVLADGGVCCIDEFETMREADRAAIHEAMEQQTLSIAKAGLVTKLRAQTAIIASTNIKKPKSNKRQQIDPFTMGFDESMVNISAPLLSRFDLVLTVRDLSLKQWDSLIADHVLDQHCEDANRCAPLSGVNDPREKPSHWWSQDMMKQYVEYVRSLRPVMTSAAEEVLKLYYQKQRQLSASESYNRPSSRTTIRMLESLVRLSQAHARLMARGQVRIQDAVAAISLMESSMKTSLILGVQNVTQSLAPTDPDGEYTRMEEMVLRALGIDDHKSPSNNGYLLSGPALSLSCP